MKFKTFVNREISVEDVIIIIIIIFTNAFKGANRVAAAGGFQVTTSVVDGTFIKIFNYY